MFKNILLKCFVFLFSVSLMSMSYPAVYKIKKVDNTQKEFNYFFARRAIANMTINEFEIRINKKLNFLEKLSFKMLKRQCTKDLKKIKLMDECDIITFKNGDEVKAIVTEVGTSEVKYKKCDNKNGPLYTMKKSDVFMIKYANGSKDFFGNQVSSSQESNNSVDSKEATDKTDGFAIVAFATGLTAFLVGFLANIPVGIALGLLALIFAIIADGNIKKSKGKLKGKSLATIGAILGLIIIIVSIILLVSL
jgi:hypothetical protein